MFSSDSKAPDQICPICPICNISVPLEKAKTDEHGRAVHETCYLLALKLPRENGFDPS